MVRVKICGITREEDAWCAVDHGADAIGFIFYPPSPRYVEPRQVRKIVAALPPFVTPVGVFVNEPAARIAATAAAAGLGAIQLHGDEPPETCLEHDLPVIRVLRVGPRWDPAAMAAYPVDTFLLDTAKAGLYGGTGLTFDWSLAREAKNFGRVILSGGIGPDNVAEAIRSVGPYAVDTGSGVEAEPGRKDPEKLARFMEQVRSVEP